jgi:hypothetical protein
MAYVTEFAEKKSVLIFDENMQTIDTKICSLFIFLGLPHTFLFTRMSQVSFKLAH